MIFLTKKTAGLLKEGIAADGRKRPVLRRQKRTRSTPTQSFWIELIEEDPDNVGRYSWKKVTPVDGEFVDTDPLIESGEEVYSARDINEATGLAGTRVEVKFAGYDTTADDEPVYLFCYGGASPMVLVKIRGTSSRSGEYAGQILEPYTYNTSTGFVLSDPETFNINCVVLNMWEQGLTGTPAVHSLPTTGPQSFVWGFIIPGEPIGLSPRKQVITFQVHPL